MQIAYHLNDDISFAYHLTGHTLSISFLALQNGDTYFLAWLSLYQPAKSNELPKQYLKIRVLMIMT